MMKNLLTIFSTTLVLLLFMQPGAVQAQDFVYQPKNPAFGGSPINYQWMLNSANAQNQYEGGQDFGFNRNPLDDFQNSLQRQILSQLTRDIIQERFGDVDLSQENSFQFGEFSIDILPGPNGIEISIFNQSSGEQTTVTIPNI